MKDQATPPGPCLMENERINKEKILLLHWKVCFQYLFYLGTVCIINNIIIPRAHVGYEMTDSQQGA